MHGSLPSAQAGTSGVGQRDALTLMF